jgi:hypothetical protein
MASDAATTTHKKVGFHAVMINWSLERLKSFSKSHSLNHHLKSHLQNSFFISFYSSTVLLCFMLNVESHPPLLFLPSEKSSIEDDYVWIFI